MHGILKLSSKLILLLTLFAVASSGQKPSTSTQSPVSKPPPPPSDQSLLQTPPEAESDVLRVETDLVDTLFTAVDKDRRFVTDIAQDDIRISENGVEQEISSFERETDRPLTLVILVDTSKSQEVSLPREKKAASAFIKSVVNPEKDRAAIVSFTGEPKIEQPLTNQISKLLAAIEKLEVAFPPDNPGCEEYRVVQEDPRCWTSIWDSIWATASQVLGQTRAGNRRAIILITDGDDTSSTIKQQDAIEEAVKNNVVVYGIGIGEDYPFDKKAIKKVSESTGGRGFFPRDDGELVAAFSQIQQELRSQYVVAYTPKNRVRDGSYRQIKIDIANPALKKRKLTLLYRKGYYARKG
ncbi:MAG TPA: VWA domain-containing protein [Pyrinomonadaceae bacterium]|nr:VWA domain-containing protein [Pyrinomonadaceae bacterium]